MDDTSTEDTVIEYREILRREITVIFLSTLTLLMCCLNTLTVYIPAQCTPMPIDMTQRMIVPSPPYHIVFSGLSRC
nr:hypothetical protein [Enterobacter asburiae]